MKYPKMQSLWKRDMDNKGMIIPGNFTYKEFNHWDRWHVTEKIDGTNIRIMLDMDMDEAFVDIRGRTDKAQLNPTLLRYLESTFTLDKMMEEFSRDEDETTLIILYGEGYGPKISKYYSDEVGFVLFDVRIGHWWLKQEDLAEIAEHLGVPRAPVISTMMRTVDIAYMVGSGFSSEFSKFDTEAEGIVARSEPLLLLRSGQRLMWKLKTKDYRRLKGE